MVARRGAVRMALRAVADVLRETDADGGRRGTRAAAAVGVALARHALERTARADVHLFGEAEVRGAHRATRDRGQVLPPVETVDQVLEVELAAGVGLGQLLGVTQ